MTKTDLNLRQEFNPIINNNTQIDLRIWSNSEDNNYFQEVGKSYEVSILSIELNTELPFCAGNKELRVDNPEKFSSFQWSTGDTTESITLNDTFFNKEVILETKSTDLCLHKDTIQINYRILDLIFKDSTIENCESNRTILELDYDKDSLEYYWFHENDKINQTNEPITTVYNKSGNYSAILIEDGCIFQSNSAAVLLSHTPYVPTLLERNDSIFYTSRGIGKETEYQWSYNKSFIQESDTNFILKIDDGLYQVNVEYENGCNRELSLDLVGLENVFNSNQQFTEIYPNPSKGFLYINGNISSKEVLIVTPLGFKINRTVDSSNKINTNDLQRGIYVLILEIQGEKYSSKFIIE